MALSTGTSAKKKSVGACQLEIAEANWATRSEGAGITFVRKGVAGCRKAILAVKKQTANTTTAIAIANGGNVPGR